MIAFKHVERSAIRGHAAEGRGDVYVGVGVSIAVSVGGKVVGNQEAADSDVLADGFAVVACHTRYKVLRRLDASGRRLNGHAWNGDGRAGPAGIGVKQFFAHHDLLARVGRV